MFLDRVVSYLYPIYCLGCSVQWQWYVCQDCHRKLQVHPEICPICHRFSYDYQVCIDCKHSTPLQGIIIWFHYHNIIKKAILKIKYQHISHIAGFFASKLDLLIKTNNSLQTDITKSNRTLLTFVPSHRTRKYFVKWYNQSELLAQTISSLTHYPTINIWSKIKKTQSQAKLNRSQRLTNIVWAFRINDNINLDGHETIVIVDDVTTTWSTIQELARTIYAQYPTIRIRGLVIARHIS